MAKLYPPIIESTISACYKENGMVKFTIPFSMNRAVSETQIGGFELKIKTVQTGAHLYTISTFNPADYKMTTNESYVIFYLNDSEQKLKIGQYYKIQLAYIEVDSAKKNDETRKYENGLITLEQYNSNLLSFSAVGYYSDTSVIKYTTKPKIYINDFSASIINNYTHNFTGYYDQTGGDTTERVYSYCFNIYDKNKNLYYTSGDCLHNSSLDNNIEITTDNFVLLRDLMFYEIYYVQYNVITTNKISLSSPLYRIIQRTTINPEIKANLEVSLNFNNGYIDVNLTPIKNDFVKRALEICVNREDYKWLNNIEDIQKEGFTLEEATLLYINKDKIDQNLTIDKYYFCSGSYVISRADEDSNFSNWEEICRFKLNNEIPDRLLFRDFNICQGKRYLYSLQQYNDNNLYSERLYSNYIMADFEDSFLYDGDIQLKIRYNPKMTKFTNTVLESKQDTLGGQFPFIFRNGYVDYREFPISGLISYLSDEEYLFISREELDILDQPHRHFTNSQDQNKINESKQRIDQMQDNLSKDITRERIFKTKVLEWLNNGKPKLFRSPTEGNFIVRLMKISLAPENKLGRMLHTFSATAYEIAEYNFQNLFALNILKEPKEIALKEFNSRTIELSKYRPGQLLNILDNTSVLIESLHFEDMFFGDTILITYHDNTQETIQIGLTGNYIIKQVVPIKNISVLPRYRPVKYVDSENIKNYYIQDNNGNYRKVFDKETYNQNTIYYEISNNPLKGTLTYNYFATLANDFSLIKNVVYNPTVFQQFIGKYDNIFNEIMDYKTEVVDLYAIKIEKRPIDRIFIASENSTDEYFYGLPHSESLPMVELEYPVGLRPYAPGRYFIYDSIKGKYVKEKSDAHYSKDVEYFLKGDYRRCRQQTKVGLSVFSLGDFYIKVGENNYILAEKFDPTEIYFLKYYDEETNVTTYNEVRYVCESEAYRYEPGKFYIIVDKINSLDKNIFTIALGEFDPKRDYYRLDTTANNYVPAYVTINDSYVYKSGSYYIRIENIKENSEKNIRYYPASSTEFNMRIAKLAMENGRYIEDAEYAADYNGETLKYYKMKPILPHIIHEVGYQSDLTNSDNQLTEILNAEKNLQFTRYLNFNRIHFKDFYNQETYDTYEPWVIINEDQFNVNETIVLDRNQLSNLSIYKIATGNGVSVELIYQTRTLEYNKERNWIEHELYEKAIDEYKNIQEGLSTKVDGKYVWDLSNPSTIPSDIYFNIDNNVYIKSIKTLYDTLIQRINSELNSKEDN